MDARSYKTRTLKEGKVQRNWFVVDAEDQVLGRLASRVAHVVRGKHKTSYTPNLNCGDNVIVINAEKIRLTGTKMTGKVYLHHTGYPGGQRERTPEQILAKDPAELVEMAVKGMLPKTKLGNDLYRNLYVYAGAQHPHTAQEPKPLKVL